MKAFFTLLVLLISFNMSAQFDVASGEDTKTLITINEISYPILVTANNSEYIICTSPRTGNDYAVWIGKETDLVHDGQPVRVSKSGKNFIFVISKNSKNPYCKYIELEV